MMPKNLVYRVVEFKDSSDQFSVPSWRREGYEMPPNNGHFITVTTIKKATRYDKCSMDQVIEAMKDVQYWIGVVEEVKE
jgi:hypothetical protein